MATEVSIYNLTAIVGGTGAMRAAFVLPIVDTSDTSQSAHGSVVKITLAQLYRTETNAVTASTPLPDIAQAWNNAAVTFVAAKINVTSTASAAASLLFDMQVGGTSQWKVSKGGATTQLGGVTATSGVFSATLAVTGVATFTAAISANAGLQLAAGQGIVGTSDNVGNAGTALLRLADVRSVLATINTLVVSTGNFQVTLGDTTLGGLLSVTGNVAINTNKFNITAATGNTAIAGTLNVVGNFSVATNKFTIAAANGNATTAGVMTTGGMATTNANAGTICLGNATAPGGTPVGGGFLYVDTGVLRYIGTSGTVTTIAPA